METSGSRMSLEKVNSNENYETYSVRVKIAFTGFQRQTCPGLKEALNIYNVTKDT